MSIVELMNSLGIPVAYMEFKSRQSLPFAVYHGYGQNNFSADDTYLLRKNKYVLEYYFKEKDETLEAAIETKILNAGFKYDKSEDAYIDTEGVSVIYYYI